MSEKQRPFDTATASVMLYLCVTVLTDMPPRPEKLTDMNLKALYGMSKFHSLEALVGEGLVRAVTLGAYTPSAEDTDCMETFEIAGQKAKRKNLLLDIERAKIFAFMEAAGIWYVPLKGIVLKELYPKMGLRQMTDNDILFDVDHREAVRDWFADNGYEVKLYGETNHDIYLKKPVYDYEMHSALFQETSGRAWVEYYAHIRDRLIQDPDNQYGYHLSEEDFYIYILAHGYKHYRSGGIGLRYLLDIYVYLAHHRATMDFTYIDRETQALGLADFEHTGRALVADVFADIHTFRWQDLPEERRDMLCRFWTSGAHGTLIHRTEYRVRQKGKLRYLLTRLFPGTDTLQDYHPIFRHKWLMPLGWLYRIGTILCTSSKRAFAELKTIFRSGTDHGS